MCGVHPERRSILSAVLAALFSVCVLACSSLVYSFVTRHEGSRDILVEMLYSTSDWMPDPRLSVRILAVWSSTVVTCVGVMYAWVFLKCASTPVVPWRMALEMVFACSAHLVATSLVSMDPVTRSGEDVWTGLARALDIRPSWGAAPTSLVIIFVYVSAKRVIEFSHGMGLAERALVYCAIVVMICTRMAIGSDRTISCVASVGVAAAVTSPGVTTLIERAAIRMQTPSMTLNLTAIGVARRDALAGKSGDGNSVSYRARRVTRRYHTLAGPVSLRGRIDTGMYQPVPGSEEDMQNLP